MNGDLMKRRRDGGLRSPVLAMCVVLAALFLAACGGSGSSGTSSGGGSGASSTGAASGEKPLKLGIILIGPKNDRSFNQAAYEGVLKAVKEHPNIKITGVLENRGTEQEQTDAVETLAQGNDIVIGVSATFGPVFDVEADKFPNTTFLTDGGYPPHYHKNVYSLTFDRLAGYQTGALAVPLTKSKVIGFVGGAEIPPTMQAMAGFEAAIKRADPSIKVLKNVIGDFNDVAKAKAATEAMLAEGADVIMPYLDAGIVGAYRAAKNKGTLIPMFKLDVFDCSQYPNIIGANIGDNNVAAYRLIKGFVTGSLKPAGVAVFAGLQDPALQRVQLCPKYAADKKIAALNEQVLADINSGKITMPDGVLNPRPSYAYKEGFDGPVQNAGATG